MADDQTAPLQPQLSHESIELLQRYRQGDPAAADELFHRYVDRLVGLARKRLSERLAQRVDAEDIVQSVYRSFFVKAHDGAYELERSGDLWRLLSAITVNKVLRQVQHHQQQKRNPNRERQGGTRDTNSRPHEELFVADPTDTDAIAMIDELEHMMRGMQPRQRSILEMRLNGLSVTQISSQVSRSEHTIRRTLGKIRNDLETRLRGLES